MSYSKVDLYVVDRPVDPARAGAIQAGDVILTFNGRQFYLCMYFVDSPLYSAPRGEPVTVEYWRPESDVTGTTHILLADPSPRQMLDRSLVYLMASLFVVTSVIILIGGAPSPSSCTCSAPPTG